MQAADLSIDSFGAYNVAADINMAMSADSSCGLTRLSRRSKMTATITMAIVSALIPPIVEQLTIKPL